MPPSGRVYMADAVTVCFGTRGASLPETLTPVASTAGSLETRVARTREL